MKNQILEIKKNKDKKVKILKWQIFLSLLGILATIMLIRSSEQANSSYESFSKTLSQTSTLSSVYKTEKVSNSNIFGTLEIPSLNINYAVFNEFNEDLLKISLCKFHGTDIGKTGNIAIAGHNFENHTFFSDLNKIKIDDEIYLYSTDNKKYVYSVYNTFETTSDNLDVLNSKFIFSKEITLVTCNNSNKKRFIVKAFLKN